MAGKGLRRVSAKGGTAVVFKAKVSAKLSSSEIALCCEAIYSPEWKLLEAEGRGFVKGAEVRS